MELVKTNMTKIFDENAFMDLMVSKYVANIPEISSKVSRVKILVLGFSALNEALTSAVVILEIKLFLNILNENLKKHIKINDSENLSYPDPDIMKRKNEVIEEINSKLSSNFTSCINKSVELLVPLTTTLNKNDTPVTIREHNRSLYIPPASKLETDGENDQNNAREGNHEGNHDDTKRNFIKQKRMTKDPKTFANLIKSAELSYLPVSGVELEAAAQILKVTLVVVNKNIRFQFGDKNLQEIIVKCSSNNQEFSSYDLFYECLKKRMDLQRMTLEEFKGKIADEVLSNPEIIKMIKNPNRQNSSSFHFSGLKNDSEIQERDPESYGAKQVKSRIINL